MNLERHPADEPALWNEQLANLPGEHLLQTWEWGALKEKYGWQALRWSWKDEAGHIKAAAQLLRRSIRLPGLRPRYSILYCPRGPVLDWSDPDLRKQVLHDLQGLTENDGDIFIKVDPDLPVGYGLPGEADTGAETLGQEVLEELQSSSWRYSNEQVQFRNTLLLDLRLPEDQLLAAMKQKTRYNIRLATRRGIRIRHGSTEDLDLLYALYAETSRRDRFPIRTSAYYRDAWGSFMQAGLAKPFIAMVDTQPVAAIVVYRFGRRSIYMHGMSRDLHREKMPNHLLQWEAIRWSKAMGCDTYDFWGASDELSPADPMWGVVRFKLGFGAQLVRTLGAWDFPHRRALYWLYAVVKPRILGWMRTRARAQALRQLE